MDRIIKIIRKICLAINWIVFSLFGLLFLIGGLGDNKGFLVLGLAMFIIAYIFSRLIVWIFSE